MAKDRKKLQLTNRIICCRGHTVFPGPALQPHTLDPSAALGLAPRTDQPYKDARMLHQSLLENTAHAAVGSMRWHPGQWSSGRGGCPTRLGSQNVPDLAPQKGEKHLNQRKPLWVSLFTSCL